MKEIVNNKYKIIKVFLILSLIYILIANTNVDAATKKNGIENFPESYRVYLNKLKEKYPNWTFTALYTGLDYNNAITKESILGGSKTISLSPLSYSRIWHHIFPNSSYSSSDSKWKYVDGDLLYQHESGWVTSSANAVKYAMDPRNFLNEVNIFEFESLSYNQGLHTVEGVEEILRGTEMYKTKISYYDTTGKKIDTDMTYAEAYMEAAKYSGVSPYNLATRTRNETGCLISTNKAICGLTTDYVGYYNYFSIGASGDPSPVINGLKYAKNKGWTSPLMAIKEGAKFLAQNYIAKGQDTLYLQKFNVTNSPYYTHQYMTDITCTYRETTSIFNTYKEMGILKNSFNFMIPVYENMNEDTDIYVKDTECFEEDEAQATINKATNLLARPSSSSPVLASVAVSTKVTMIYSGLESSAYNKVKLASGLEGYIHYSSFNMSPTTDNTLMYVVNTSVLNVRQKAGTTSSKIATVNAGDKVTRIEKYSAPIASGDTRIWDKVRLSNGTVGYVCRVDTDSTVYLKKYEYVKVTSISINKDILELPLNTTVTLTAAIQPTNAEIKAVSWSSSNEAVVKVSSTGVLTPIKAGTATITVKSQDQGKTDTCSVTVVQKNLGISFEKNEYTLKVGESVNPKINYTLSNVTSKYILDSLDSQIVKVENGSLKGIKVGTTKATATVEGTTEKAEVTIKVVENKTNYYSFDSSLSVDENSKIITKINPNTTKLNLLSKISSDYTINILNESGEELENDKNVGTGTVIQIKNGNVLVNSYTVVIYGDVTGDGKISAVDYIAIKNHIMETKLITAPYSIAADSNKDGSIKALDYIAIKNHIMGTKLITQ